MIYEQMQMNVLVFSPCLAFKSQKEQPTSLKCTDCIANQRESKTTNSSITAVYLAQSSGDRLQLENNFAKLEHTACFCCGFCINISIMWGPYYV